MGRFLVVDEDAIRDGRCTDVYFERVAGVMEMDAVNPYVTMEVTAANLPGPWGVFCGLSDVVELLEGIPVDVDAMPEGSIFSQTNRSSGSRGATGTSRSTRPRSWGSSATPRGWHRRPPGS